MPVQGARRPQPASPVDRGAAGCPLPPGGVVRSVTMNPHCSLLSPCRTTNANPSRPPPVLGLDPQPSGVSHLWAGPMNAALMAPSLCYAWAMLRVLTLATLFPSSARPTFGVFVERQTCALAAREGVAVGVVAPVGLPVWPLSLHPHSALLRD